MLMNHSCITPNAASIEECYSSCSFTKAIYFR